MKPIFPSRMICALAALGCFAIVNAATTTPDVSGVWKWTSQGRDGQERERSLTLQQEGTKVTGTTPGFRGDAMPITEGKIDGDKLNLKIARETERGSFTINYQGKVDGNTITGEVQMKFGDRETSREWVAKRADADIVGTWKWSMERPDGQVWEATLKFKQEGETLTGTIGREDMDWEVELKKVKVAGSTLSFLTLFERDGNSMTIENKAIVAGKTMKGKAKRQDSEDEAREWKATKEE